MIYGNPICAERFAIRQMDIQTDAFSGFLKRSTRPRFIVVLPKPIRSQAGTVG
ncbi:MAG: hypothetical protein ACJAS3_003623 [Roseivirga sp.]|jgi:hypothetical protein